MGVGAYPAGARGCGQQLLLDLLPYFLHRHLGLLDGSLSCVKPAGVRGHKDSSGQSG